MHLKDTGEGEGGRALGCPGADHRSNSVQVPWVTSTHKSELDTERLPHVEWRRSPSSVHEESRHVVTHFMVLVFNMYFY